MNLVLHRIYLTTGTVGILEVGEHRFWTLEELAGVDFGPGCCIREGDYALEPHSGARFKDTWAVVGRGVAHWSTTDTTDRETVLFHVGNVLADTEGCILVGTGLLLGKTMLLGSRQGFEEFRALLRESTGAHTLRIQRG